jgi:hypothetical protein
MAPEAAQVKVRVQARDGKILGPAVQPPLLSVRDVVTGEMWITNEPMNNKSSGTVVPEDLFSVYGEVVSRNAIVVQPSPINPPPTVHQPFPTPGPYWLKPPVGEEAGEGELIAHLPLTKPSLLEFRATAYAPDEVYASATMWVMPGMQLLADPGLVLTIAGLYTTVEASVVGSTVNVAATVTMMCGCPITVPPPHPPPPKTELYWPATEFEVWARIRVKGSNDEPVALLLSFESTNKFTGSLQRAPATYEVSVVAVQPKETNVGYASTTVVVT